MLEKLKGKLLTMLIRSPLMKDYYPKENEWIKNDPDIQAMKAQAKASLDEFMKQEPSPKKKNNGDASEKKI